MTVLYLIMYVCSMVTVLHTYYGSFDVYKKLVLLMTLESMIKSQGREVET